MAVNPESFDVVVIGAGPSGSVAAAMLKQQSHRVLVLEREHFPRFSIGESLLPQCMTFLEQAGMLEAVQQAGFQFKNGAAFYRGEATESFDFSEKTSAGWGTTFQVQRARFDKILADEAQNQGVEVRFGHRLTGFNSRDGGARLVVKDEAGEDYQVDARFVLDASGFGRVLPRLLDLEEPSRMDSRTALFTHICDRIDDPRYDRNKIMITVHPQQPDVWFWLIPFSDGRASVGVVAPHEVLDRIPGENLERLQQLIGEANPLGEFLQAAVFDTDIRSIKGYSSDVKQLYGDNFALLGNAGEFLDPVFSSGVTIALKSANLAATVLDRQLKGLQPDWEQEFALPLREGVNTFRIFVESWYDGRLQGIIFANNKNDHIKRMICSIFAGYAWDKSNPYTKPGSRIDTLAELCRES
jgi:flavin-dependent dehydrogenase